ncbi:unnamed protein product [Trichogramma brassicae]|uniref:Uncharacterized protein n=1 Tax=Trichogramma brassicae TaxID=86971 RepID=A0A6H5IYN7_9HYME|nr:unnamed protein product [Trichogramma brassicae]
MSRPVEAAAGRSSELDGCEVLLSGIPQELDTSGEPILDKVFIAIGIKWCSSYVPCTREGKTPPHAGAGNVSPPTCF